MSERIKALRTLYLLYPDELDEVFAHIDHLTAELARRQQQVETLQEIREEYIHFKQAVARAWGSIGDSVVADFMASAKRTLAATAEPGGEGGGR